MAKSVKGKKIEPLSSIPQLTREANAGGGRQIHVKTMSYRIKKLAALDKDRGEEQWLFKIGGRWLINKAILRINHPELFERHYVTREEHDELSERVDQLEETTCEHKKKMNALGARIRGLGNQTCK